MLSTPLLMEKASIVSQVNVYISANLRVILDILLKL